MTEQAQLPSLHAAPQAELWEFIARGEPERAVRALAVHVSQADSDDGDTPADVADAYVGIARVGSTRGLDWDALVAAGVIAQLCRNVAQARADAVLPPQDPYGLEKEGRLEAPPTNPYAAPLELLSKLSMHLLKSPLGKTERRIMDDLKVNWAIMMDRLWEEAYWKRQPGEGHAHEPEHFALLLARMLNADTSFFSTVYEPDNRTIPVVASLWTASGSPDNVGPTSGVIWDILSDKGPPGKTNYLRAHPPPAGPVLLARVYEGIAPDVPRAEQAERLFGVLARHLRALPPAGAPLVLDALAALLDAATPGSEADVGDEDCHHAMRGARELWAALVGALRAVATEPTRPGRPPTRTKIVALAAQSLTLPGGPPARGLLLESLVAAEFFEALENLAETIVQDQMGTYMLSQIALGLLASGEHLPPSTQAALRTAFPRWIIAGRALRHDATNQNGPPPAALLAGGLGNARPDDARAWNHMCWQLWSFLCLELGPPAGTCARRGCGQPGKMRCALCKDLSYCGKECQKADWKGHKLVCGWMHIIRQSTGLPASTPNMPASTPNVPAAAQLADDLD